MSHIVMILSNAFRPDPRVKREAQVLSNAGHRVTLICWDRQAELSAYETQNDFKIIRVHTVKSAYGSGWRQSFYLPRFWREVVQLAAQLQPDVIHCHDLDTLYAGWKLKKKLGCRLVYDSHENYPALMSLYLPSVFIWALKRWQHWLMSKVDVTITASTILAEEFRTQGIEPVVALGNYHSLTEYRAISDADAQACRAKLGVSPDTLLVAYIGGFSYDRMLSPFIDTASFMPDVQFYLWGNGPLRAMVEQAAKIYPNVSYGGWLHPSKLPLYFKAVDIIYYCLKPDYPGAIYNAPNTLSQAMVAGRPIIANNVGDLGRIVGETRCGILVDKITPAGIMSAINQLRDREVRLTLGTNGINAAIQKYSAEAVSQQFINTYHSLVRKV